MVEYPDANRYIPATQGLLGEWCGPVEEFVGPGDRWAASVLFDGGPVLPRPGERRYRLDPTRHEIRDHLVRRLALPGWMRDGAWLEPWQSAGLIACAAAGTEMRGILSTWGPRWCEGYTRINTAGPHLHARVGQVTMGRHNYREGWEVAVPLFNRTAFEKPVASGSETGEAGKVAADAAAFAHGCALMLDADAMVLPWPGGPRVWRRT